MAQFGSYVFNKYDVSKETKSMNFHSIKETIESLNCKTDNLRNARWQSTEEHFKDIDEHFCDSLL